MVREVWFVFCSDVLVSGRVWHPDALTALRENTLRAPANDRKPKNERGISPQSGGTVPKAKQIILERRQRPEAKQKQLCDSKCFDICEFIPCCRHSAIQGCPNYTLFQCFRNNYARATRPSASGTIAATISARRSCSVIVGIFLKKKQLGFNSNNHATTTGHANSSSYCTKRIRPP